MSEVLAQFHEDCKICQGTTLQAAEKLLLSPWKRQGTTSVVPNDLHNHPSWASAPAIFVFSYLQFHGG
jgi:hypothetical protein